LWYNFAPRVQVFDLPSAVKEKLLRYTPSQQPTWSKNIEFDTRPIINQQEELKPLLELHQDPGCLDYCLKSIPLTPWIHQLKILRQFSDNYPKSALICDEVGLGKTISTGLIIRYLILRQKVKRVLILVPASVQTQWHEELREKFNLHFWSYNQGSLVNNYKEIYQPLENGWNEKDLILASSHLVRRSAPAGIRYAARARELLKADNWDLIILDEAHHARRKSSKNRENIPNCLLTLLQGLKEKTKCLLLLTATPMQIDTIEVFDLLDLLGLKGKWQYQDNFCDYFESLSQSPNKANLEFWQKMSVDYFQQGGKICPVLEEYLSNGKRLLFYQLTDIWKEGKKITKSKEVSKDKEFITASRHFLSIHTPIKDLMFRHTRDTLREYYKRGILSKDIPTRKVFDQAIALEVIREVPLYQAVSEYVRHFYNLAQQEKRKGLGFLMTLYRRRLTSSFYAIKKSLERRLEGISITDDDLVDLEEADDSIITGLESYFTPTDPLEIEYLENLLREFENTGEDSKLSAFITILRQELIERESVIVFFQYTDTMDYVRDTLVKLYGSQIACYSGRGGELYQEGKWRVVKKDLIKKLFREGEVKILLCTKSASEGLNLQTCGVIIMYSVPWNPLLLEQQIGRLDRIGQVYSTIRIHNLFYDGTVEARVYRRLRDRINAFETVVGNLQPILAQIPTFIEKAVMAADPEEEGVLLSELDFAFANQKIRPDLEKMITEIELDLALTRQKIPQTPITPQDIERLLTRSPYFKHQGINFIDQGNQIWQLIKDNKSYQVTFYPPIFEEYPSLRLMSYGDPLFEELLY
jgi:SNF2 family DNA or RNA helicase